MPIRHLDYYTGPRGQVHPLSILNDTRLGIDAAAWMKKVSAAAVSEQYLAGIGGTPSCLRKAIEKELAGFKQHGIHPVFVFNGLALIRKDKPYIHEDPRITKRNAAWEAVNAGKLELAMSSWSSSNFVHAPDLVHLVIRILKDNNVEYMRAPYGSGAQLVYMERHHNQIINAIYAGSEQLMFDVERVITSVDFDKGTFSVLSKKAILLDMHLSDDQFLDLCILAGNEPWTTFPPIMTEGAFAIKGILELLRQHRTGFNIVKAHADVPSVQKSNYIDVFCRTRCAMKYQPILTDEGHVEPLNAEHAPSDIHEFIGYRLPDEVYYYFSRGMISEMSFNSLLWGHAAEYTPLCNGETKEYRQLISTTLLELKSQTLSLLTAHLHQFYHTRNVSIAYWFEPAGTPEHHIKHDQTAEALKALSNWKSGPTSLATAANFTSVIEAVQTAADAAATVRAETQAIEPLTTVVAIRSRHLAKLLQLRKFLGPNHVPTPLGKALTGNIKSSSSGKELYQDETFVALELIRAQVLTARPYSITYSKQQVVDDAAVASHIRLVCRVVSLVGVRFNGTKPWTGPLSRDLLAFNSMSKAMIKHLRLVSEALMLDMFLNNECQREGLDFASLGTGAPFGYESSTVMGILFKTFLEHRVLNKSSDVDASVANVEEILGVNTQALSGSVKEELQRGFEFWNRVKDAVKVLAQQQPKGAAAAVVISPEAAKEFSDAETWLAGKKI